MQTLADCLASDGKKSYYVDCDRYHFEIVSTGVEAFVNVFIDYGFGGSHFHELREERAETWSKENPTPERMRLFADSILRFIESYPAARPLDREMLFAKYEARMEGEYRSLLGMARDIHDASDLYDVLPKDGCEEASVLVRPKGDDAIILVKPPSMLAREMNLEHLRRLCIEDREGDTYGFLDENRKNCIFGDATVFYCKELDTEGHPIPMLVNMIYNTDGDRVGEPLKDRYPDVLNYLAVKENRALFRSLTPEVIESHKRDLSPIVFHDVTDFYAEDPDYYYHQTYDHPFSVPVDESNESILGRIEQELLECDLI